MKMPTHLIVVCAVLAAGSRTLAAAPIETRPIHFTKGTASTTVKGAIEGDQTIDYKVRAKAGQTLSVEFVPRSGASYFNVLPPGSNDVAIFVGSTGGNEWSGTLPSDGEYTVRVYQMRSAARRKESSAYTLTIAVTGTAGAAAASGLGNAPPADAKVKGTPYHATGQLDCWMGNAPANSSRCEFGVIRGKPGNAEVHVKPPGGLERVLTFMGNKVTSGTDKVTASMSGDLWTVEVNDYEHYKVPEAVISGG